MPSFKPREHKTAEGGGRVIVYRDSTGAWYVGAPAAGEPCSPMPMGAFITREAARRWADRRFPGGAWSRATGEPPLPAGTHLPRLPRTALSEN